MGSVLGPPQGSCSRSAAPPRLPGPPGGPRLGAASSAPRLARGNQRFPVIFWSSVARGYRKGWKGGNLFYVCSGMLRHGHWSLKQGGCKEETGTREKDQTQPPKNILTKWSNSPAQFPSPFRPGLRHVQPMCASRRPGQGCVLRFLFSEQVQEVFLAESSNMNEPRVNFCWGPIQETLACKWDCRKRGFIAGGSSRLLSK